MSTSVIEYGVPLPEPRGSLVGRLRALKAAKVGASIFFPEKDASVRSLHATIQRIGPGWAACRKVEGGIRVWRVR